jgi:hypothetical protein
MEYLSGTGPKKHSSEKPDRTKKRDPGHSPAALIFTDKKTQIALEMNISLLEVTLSLH